MLSAIERLGCLNGGLTGSASGLHEDCPRNGTPDQPPRFAWLFCPYFTVPGDWTMPPVKALRGQATARGEFALCGVPDRAGVFSLRIDQRGATVWFRIG